MLDDVAGAKNELKALAQTLARNYQGASASLREGLNETLVVT